MRAHLDPVEELGNPARLDRRVVAVAHLEPCRVQVLVHLGSDRTAHRARRFAGGMEAAVDRRRIRGIQNHQPEHVLGGEIAVLVVIHGDKPLGHERHRPWLRPREAGLDHLVRQQRHLVSDIEQACGVFGALDVARHPEELVGGSAEHRGTYLATTHVSLVPPPCDEFTTSDPSRSATRVRPPGTRVTCLPDST